MCVHGRAYMVVFISLCARWNLQFYEEPLTKQNVEVQSAIVVSA